MYVWDIILLQYVLTCRFNSWGIIGLYYSFSSFDSLNVCVTLWDESSTNCDDPNNFVESHPSAIGYFILA